MNASKPGRRLLQLFRLLLFGTVAGCRTSGSSAHDAPPGYARTADSALGIRFAYPESLLMGRFAAESMPVPPAGVDLPIPFRQAVVLVARADLGRLPLNAIPVGEVPALWIDRPIAAELVFRLFRPESTYTIGDKEVYRFPGYPGPYGDQAFYYLVTWPDSFTLEVVAHRYHWGHSPKTPTGYGAVIEAIIPTLERFKTR